TPKAASTPAPRPATFRAVPESRVRSSLMLAECSASLGGFPPVDPRLLEVSEAAQTLLDLALLVGAEHRRRAARDHRLVVEVTLDAQRGGNARGEVCKRDLGPVAHLDAGS